MKTTKIFSKNLQAYIDRNLLIINQGGSSSSKTFSVLQLLYQIAITSKSKKIISIVSYTFPHLKLGAIRDFENILIEECIVIENIRNKTELTYQVGNCIIEFFSADNLSKVHGPRRDILFINECNHLSYDVYTQLVIRTKKAVFLDYNPVREFWVHTEVIPKEKHVLIKSTYKDNCYLDQSIIDKIESRQSNENWWRVYGLGEVGYLEGTIFNSWIYGEFDNSLPYVYGLDFGVKDPDAMIKVAVNHKTKQIYLDEIIYKNNQNTDTLYREISAKISKRNALIIADSAGLRTIKDLQLKGLNVKSVVKNKILDDIKLISNYQLVLTENSYNLAKELMNYVWADKKGEVPIDDQNHGLDSVRYATTVLINKKKKIIR
jgi:phage terminase large subunit